MAYLAFFVLAFCSSFVRWEPAPYDVLFFPVFALAFRHLSWKAWHALLLGFFLLFTLAHLPSLAANLGASAWESRAFLYAFVTFYLALSAFLVMGLQDRISFYLLWGYFAGALFSAFLGILAFLRVPGLEGLLWGGSRAVAFFQDPNVFGAFLVPAILLALAQAERGGRLWVLPAMVLLLGVLFSLSRGAWLNLGIALLGFWLLRPKRRMWLLVAFSVSFLGFLVVSSFLSQNPVASRLGIMPYDQDRFAAQAKAFNLSLENPLGWGPGFSEIILNYATHNTYLRLSLEVGWLGLWTWLLLMGLTLIYALYQGLRRKSLWHEVFFASLLGILVESFVIDTLHWRHLWLILGLAWADNAKERHSLPHHPR